MMQQQYVSQYFLIRLIFNFTVLSQNYLRIKDLIIKTYQYNQYNQFNFTILIKRFQIILIYELHYIFINKSLMDLILLFIDSRTKKIF